MQRWKRIAYNGRMTIEHEYAIRLFEERRLRHRMEALLKQALVHCHNYQRPPESWEDETIKALRVVEEDRKDALRELRPAGHR